MPFNVAVHQRVACCRCSSEAWIEDVLLTITVRAGVFIFSGYSDHVISGYNIFITRMCSVLQSVCLRLDCQYELRGFWPQKKRPVEKITVRDSELNWWWRLLMKRNDEMGRKNHQERMRDTTAEIFSFIVYFTMHVVSQKLNHKNIHFLDCGDEYMKW